MMDIIKVYEAAADKLRMEFCDHMGYEGYDGFRIGQSARVASVNDQFRSVQDMYEVLKYDMNPDIVFERYNLVAEEKSDCSLYGYRYNHPNKIANISNALTTKEQIESECLHEHSGLMLMSDPPKRICRKCGAYFKWD